MFTLRLIAGLHEQVDPDGVTRTHAAPATIQNKEDLAARWPTKFVRPGVQDRPSAETDIRPGESISEFARRMLDLAAAKDGVAPETVEVPKASMDEYISRLRAAENSDLRAWADAEELTYTDATTKEQLVQMLAAIPPRE